MSPTEEDMTRVIGPLVYGVADQDGVTKALIKYIQQIREADRKEQPCGQTALEKKD